MFQYNASRSGISLAGLQEAIDASDVVGRWDWDIPADCLTADALVALLFNIDPASAESGVPLSAFKSGIHPADCARVARLIETHGRSGTSYLAEYRVCSADGVTRRVLARGRFHRDRAGHPLRGRGIIIDVTRGRADDAPAAGPETASLLEQAAGSFLEGHRILRAMQDQPRLRQVADVLLFETGRALAAQESRERRARMN